MNDTLLIGHNLFCPPLQHSGSYGVCKTVKNLILKVWSVPSPWYEHKETEQEQGK